MEKMRAALVIVPTLTNEVNQTGYLRDCMKIVRAEGFIPFCPNIFEKYTGMTQIEYARNVIHLMDAAFFFTDFGEDDVMSYIAEMIDQELIRRRTTGIAAEKYRNSLDGILHQVSEKTGIPVSRLKNCERKREVVDARFVYFRRAKEKTRHSLIEIGKLVHKDHSTVLHGIREANKTREIQTLYKKCFSDETT